MNKDDMLRSAVDKLTDPLYMQSKTEIWEYFLDQNKGDRKKAASAAARALSGESSGTAYKNARRNFEGSRVSPQKGDTSKWKVFGTKLPEIGRKLKGDSITVTIQGTQPGKGHKGTRNRNIEITLTGANARDFINDPGYDALWDEYGVDLGDDSDYAVEIYSVG